MSTFLHKHAGSTVRLSEVAAAIRADFGAPRAAAVPVCASRHGRQHFKELRIYLHKEKIGQFPDTTALRIPANVLGSACSENTPIFIHNMRYGALRVGELVGMTAMLRRRLLLGAACALGWVVLGGQEVVGAPICPPYDQSIHLNFQTRLTEPRYNNSVNISGIRNLSRVRGLNVTSAHSQALGVAFMTPAFSLQASSRVRGSPEGYCVYLDRVSADFGFDAVEVFIASEYAPGTCEYRTIRDHENQHVAINKETLKSMAPYVRAGLEKILARKEPIFSADPKNSTSAAVDQLSKKMSPVLNRFEEELMRRHSRIDTSSNYKATAEVCREWNRGVVWPQGNSGEKKNAPIR